MRALVTGSAGFIGFHLCQRLLAEGHAVTGFDGFSDYYDVSLKRSRHAKLAEQPDFTSVEGRLETPGLLRGLLGETRPDVVVHLAAQHWPHATCKIARLAEVNLRSCSLDAP